MKALQLIKSKVKDRSEIKSLLNVWRFKEESIVFTNGCFDLLHQGHIDYLAKASDLGKHLVVGVNSDDSVRQLGKGANRPLQDQNSRDLIIAALHFVDLVLIFDEDTPEKLIKEVKPNVLVKGSDYSIDQIVGGNFVLKNGGQVKTIDFLPGYSTSNIVKKVLR